MSTLPEETTQQDQSLQSSNESSECLRSVSTEELYPKLVRLDTLMGSGASEETIIATCDAIREFYPNMEVMVFRKALSYGIVNVKWVGKMSFMAVAEFIREYRKHLERQAPHNPMA